MASPFGRLGASSRRNAGVWPRPRSPGSALGLSSTGRPYADLPGARERTQHALANAISHAHFMDARDISDVQVLGDLPCSTGSIGKR